jgi:nitrogen regulatory protein P-II 1
MSEAGMRQIEAIVRREKVPDVDKALRSLGVSGMTMTEARGRGRGKVITASFVKGKWTFSTEFIHRAIINVVVDARDVDRVVESIVKSASTKTIGDGKIFVYPIERAIDISTGEDDDHALNPGRPSKRT